MPSCSPRRIAAALGAASLSMAIALPAAAGDAVGFALDWVVNGTHAGYFVAQKKDNYGEAGLDVTLSRGFGSGDTIKRVATGTASFGLADTGAIIAAQANEEVPVRIVAMIYDRATLGIIYLAESGIKGPKDLEGRKIGLSPASCHRTDENIFRNNIRNARSHA
jgi:NitT/TauT family transport system substrate-binding protein